MNLFGWIGVFFIFGGGMFACAAWSMSRAKRITAVEAKVISLIPGAEAGEEKTKEAADGQDGMDAAVEYEFTLEGETLRVQSHSPTSRAVGETEKMYYDTFSGALIHPRVLGSMIMAAAAFAFAGLAMILFQHTLLP